MAKTNFWLCTACGQNNRPHGFRLGRANEKCEQCGASRETGVDQEPR